jgi:hypothetical protein
MAQETFGKQRLIYSILKFLDKEIQNETSNAERRESIEGKLNFHLKSILYLSILQSPCNVLKHHLMSHLLIHIMI